MYQYCNVHPKGLLVGDCVKRAITKATGMDYHQVSLELNRHKKISGARKFNYDNNWKSYIEKVLDGVWKPFPAKRGMPRMNGERFCESFPKGSYILSMAGHLSCCIDGVIYDTWDCTQKCVYGCYEIQPKVKRSYKVDKIRNKDEYIITVYEGEDIKTFTSNKSELKGMTKCLDLMHFEREGK